MTLPEPGDSAMAQEAPEVETQEVAETKEETREAPEETERVEQATFEPEAVVEREGDYQQAEAIETAFVKVVEAPISQAASLPPDSGGGQTGRSDDPYNYEPADASVSSRSVESLPPDSGGGQTGRSDDPYNFEPADTSDSSRSVESLPPDSGGGQTGRSDDPYNYEPAYTSDSSGSSDVSPEAGDISMNLVFEDQLNSQVSQSLSSLIRSKAASEKAIIDNIRGDEDTTGEVESGKGTIVGGVASDSPAPLTGTALTLEQALSGKPALESEAPEASQGEVKDVPFDPVKIVSKPESGEEAQTPVVGTAEQTMDLDTYAEKTPEISAVEAVAEAKETAAEAERLAAEAAAAEVEAEAAAAEADAAAFAATAAEAYAEEARNTAFMIWMGGANEWATYLGSVVTDGERAQYQHDLAEAQEHVEWAEANAAAKATAAEEAQAAADAAAAEAAALAEQAEAAAAAAALALAVLRALIGAEAAERVLSEAVSGEDVPGTGTGEAEPAGETDEDA